MSRDVPLSMPLSKAPLFLLSLALLASASSSLAMAMREAPLLPTSPTMTMREALQRAIDSDPAVAASLAERAADREAGVQERATRLPQINAIGAINTTDADVINTPFGPGFQERYDSWSVSAELRQPLFRYDFLARGHRADAQDQLGEQAFIQRGQALVVRVADRYLAVLKATNELVLAQIEADAVNKSLGDVRKRYDVQLVAGTDLKEAQARNDLAQANLLSAQQAVESAQDALDETTGNGRAQLFSLKAATALPELDSLDAEVWLTRARANSPAYQQKLVQVELAQANVTSRRSEALPTVDVVATHGRQDMSESRIGSKANSTVFGLEMRLPIFTGGAQSSKVREAQARLTQAQAEQARSERELLRETRRLFREVQTARAQSLAFQRAVESAQAAEQATRYGYEAGKRTITDVLNAQSNTVQAQRNLDRSRYDVVLKVLQLKQQAGVLDAADLTAIDTLLTSDSAPRA
ncbi:MAG: TolC family outer membrane protein [Pseudomonadota bacterium]